MCLRLLTARARTRAELAGQLAKRGYPDDVGNRVLDRLATVGLIDDAAFAEQWVQSRRHRSGKSNQALAAELRGRGVDSDVIATVLDDLDADSDRHRAEQLVRARLRRETLGASSQEDLRISRRLAAMLARRGYSLSLAYAVVSAALAAERDRRRV